MWPRQVRRSFMRDVKGLFEKCYGDAVSRKKQNTVLWKKALSARLPWKAAARMYLWLLLHPSYALPTQT